LEARWQGGSIMMILIGIGFNGMEKDDEMKGNGNSYTTEFRFYDSRVARWISLDPEMQRFPTKSPFVGYSDNPIIFVDPKGDADYYNSQGEYLGSFGEKGDGRIIVVNNYSTERKVKKMFKPHKKAKTRPPHYTYFR
jgi:RHS repeat-associated protein